LNGEQKRSHHEFLNEQNGDDDDDWEYAVRSAKVHHNLVGNNAVRFVETRSDNKW
jgi:hypothetical protein